MGKSYKRASSTPGTRPSAGFRDSAGNTAVASFLCRPSATALKTESVRKMIMQKAGKLGQALKKTTKRQLITDASEQRKMISCFLKVNYLSVYYNKGTQAKRKLKKLQECKQKI